MSNKYIVVKESRLIALEKRLEATTNYIPILYKDIEKYQTECMQLAKSLLNFSKWAKRIIFGLLITNIVSIILLIIK